MPQLRFNYFKLTLQLLQLLYFNYHGGLLIPLLIPCHREPFSAMKPRTGLTDEMFTLFQGPLGARHLTLANVHSVRQCALVIRVCTRDLCAREVLASWFPSGGVTVDLPF